MSSFPVAGVGRFAVPWSALGYHPAVSLTQDVIIVLGVLAAAWALLVAAIWLHRPSRAVARTALRLIPDLVRLALSLIGDTSTPRGAKVALGGLLVYLLSPIDLIPDFVPGLGSIDDIAIAAVVLRWAGRRVGVDGLYAHWTGSDADFELLRRLIGF
jgi:uncharacterized membrane protein YkvA (DUF1232 family)